MNFEFLNFETMPEINESINQLNYGSYDCRSICILGFFISPCLWIFDSQIMNNLYKNALKQEQSLTQDLEKFESSEDVSVGIQGIHYMI